MKSLFSLIFVTSVLCGDNIPLINPTKVIISDAVQCVNKKKEIGCSKLYSAIELTGVDWLDNMMLDSFTDYDLSNLSIKQKIEYIRADDKKWLEDSTKDIKEFEMSFGYTSHTDATFLYQRYNLATMKKFYSYYNGGAHDMYRSEYDIIDLKSKKKLTIDDIVVSGKKADLALLLLALYEDSYEYGDTFLPAEHTKKLEALLVNNFYFSPAGLVFVYAPYEVGPYADGTIEMEIYYNNLDGILKTEYMR